MRIISGEFKGRKLHTPPDGEKTRPIPDRVKTALFNLLRGHYEGETVFDGFAGTGAIGLEAASRGAARVVLVERDREIAAICRANIEHLGASACELVEADALGPAALARCPAPVHLIFFDPPYPLVRDPDGWARVRAQFARLIDKLDDTGFAVLRTPWPFTRRIDATPRPRAAEETVVVDLSDDAAEDALDAFEAALAAEAARARGRDAAHEDVDLGFDNAEGPETHVYRHTALHLYMRRRG